MWSKTCGRAVRSFSKTFRVISLVHVHSQACTLSASSSLAAPGQHISPVSCNRVCDGSQRTVRFEIDQFRNNKRTLVSFACARAHSLRRVREKVMEFIGCGRRTSEFRTVIQSLAQNWTSAATHNSRDTFTIRQCNAELQAQGASSNMTS